MHKRIGNWQQLMEFMFKGLAVLSLKQVDSIMGISKNRAEHFVKISVVLHFC